MATKVHLNALPDEYYERRLSDAAKSRTDDGIRALLPLETRPGLISLLAGKPNSDTFPITSLQFTMQDVTSPSAPDLKLELTQDELNSALQYTFTNGLSELREWLIDWQTFQHGRQRGEGWTVSIGAGSQDLIFKAANALLNPGDSILIETPVYAGTLPVIMQLGCEMIEVETDDDGIRDDVLRTILENWPPSKPKPKALYTIPYGSNPTGKTATLERRLGVLALSREHDFLILEDDPYYNLYYGKAARPPSYFTLEREQPEVGRVIRFDSFSKIVSSGIRLGWVSGPERILASMTQHTMAVNLQPSSLSQTLVLKILRTWGHEGFVAHLSRLAEFYRGKRDVFEDAMQRHLAGLAEWTKPEAGMFFWFKLLLNDSEGAEQDSEDIIRTKALEKGVLALPGKVFHPSGRETAYVRAAFSLLPPSDVDEALRRLREVLLEERKVREQ